MTKWRRMRWSGHIAQIGGKRTAYRLFMGNPEGKRPVGRRRHKTDLGDIGFGGMDWIGLAQDKDK
jgi:hypothetical protein